MGTVDYTELYAKAIEESGAGSETVPDGDYRVKIGSVKGGRSKKQKPQVGIRLVILEGAHAGKSTWVNQTFTAENPDAVAVFLRIMRQLGVPMEAINAGIEPGKLADYIVVGSEGTATLGHHDWNGEPRQDLKKFTLDSMPVGGVAPAMATVPQVVAAPAAPVPVVPVAQPVVVQQEMVAAAPVAVVPAPAPAQPVVVAVPAPGTPPF